jgi:hypothetical protein
MANITTIIESLRIELEKITWLEKSYGRAWPHVEMRGSKQVRLPKCFDGTEYLNVLPNDNYKSQSFIAVRTPEKYENFNRDGNNFKSRDLSIIFWGNLKEINTNKTGIYVSDLKDEIEQVLCTIPELSSINQVFDEKAEDIFQGYTLSDIDTQYLMYPFAGLRFDITVKFNDTSCL